MTKLKKLEEPCKHPINKLYRGYDYLMCKKCGETINPELFDENKKLEELKKEIERRINMSTLTTYNVAYKDALKWVLEKIKEIENES